MTAIGKDALRFREAMSRVPMAVHVVTTDGPAGRHGATATAVASVTDDPPTLLVCLNRSSTLFARVRENGVVALSVLGAKHEAVARAFARSSGGKPDARFSVGHWETGSSGVPVLSDALATFEGKVTSAQDVGTHAVILVAVEAAHPIDPLRDSLLYHRRSYTEQLRARAHEPAAD